MENYISYSELKDWYQCAYFHKLKHIDDISTFAGNIFTAFGKAIHHVCETQLFESTERKKEVFTERLQTEVKELNLEIQQKEYDQFQSQGLNIIDYILPALQEKFGEFEIVSAEEQLYEPIKEFLLAEYSFKGFIDLIIKTKDGKYHVIDWKTCSWGWDLEKKSDRMVFSQLLLYKHFFAQKQNIDLKNIDTYFILLKRTAKKDNVEIFRVTSGPERMQDSITLLKNALSNIHNKKYIKNRLNCSKCEFNNTQHCVR